MTLGMILPSAVAPAFSPVQNIVLALENQIFQAFGREYHGYFRQPLV